MAQDGVAARTIESLPPPVEGPTVWYGPDMMKRSDWIHTLSDADVAEIERACGRSRSAKPTLPASPRPTSRYRRWPRGLPPSVTSSCTAEALP